ncbi:YcxB family protein [Mesorhizobium sp. CN2-181]
MMLLIFTALGAILLSIHILLPWRVRRIFAQQKSLHDEIHIDWSDEEIAFKSERGYFKFRWNDFVKIAESKEVIILHQSDVMFNFIPKRVLSTDQAASMMSHGAG